MTDAPVTLAPVIETAILLHDLERDLDAWEHQVSRLADDAVARDPSMLRRTCRSIELLTIPVATAFRIHCAQDVRTRSAAGLSDDLAQTVRDQAKRFAQLGDRLLAVRRSLRRTTDTLLATIMSMAREDLYMRLLRIMPFDTPLSVGRVTALINADHLAVHEVDMAWRDMTGPRPRLVIVENTPQSEVAAVLDALAKGRALRRRRGLRGTTWSRAA